MICLRVEKPRRGDEEKEKNKSTVENTRGRGGTPIFSRGKCRFQGWPGMNPDNGVRTNRWCAPPPWNFSKLPMNTEPESRKNSWFPRERTVARADHRSILRKFSRVPRSRPKKEKKKERDDNIIIAIALFLPLLLPFSEFQDMFEG